MQVYIEYCYTLVKKPLILGEFGKSLKLPGYSIENRNAYFRKLYDGVYSSAKGEPALVAFSGSCLRKEWKPSGTDTMSF